MTNSATRRHKLPERYIYHITTETRWRIARSKGEYSAPSLEEEGFIHCSTMAQVFGVANAFYLDETDEVLLLELDSERIQAEVRYEAPNHPRAANDSVAAENLFLTFTGNSTLMQLHAFMKCAAMISISLIRPI